MCVDCCFDDKLCRALLLEHERGSVAFANAIGGGAGGARVFCISSSLLLDSTGYC